MQHHNCLQFNEPACQPLKRSPAPNRGELSHNIQAPEFWQGHPCGRCVSVAHYQPGQLWQGAGWEVRRERV